MSFVHGAAGAGISADRDAHLVLARFLPYRFSIVAERINKVLAQRYDCASDLTIRNGACWPCWASLCRALRF